MMYAKKIKMQAGCSHSNNTQEIAEIYIDGCNNPGFFPKSTFHYYLIKNPNSIKVNLSPYPFLVPATSSRGEKYRFEPLLLWTQHRAYRRLDNTPGFI